jgi:hypothetical protein
MSSVRVWRRRRAAQSQDPTMASLVSSLSPEKLIASMMKKEKTIATAPPL